MKGFKALLVAVIVALAVLQIYYVPIATEKTARATTQQETVIGTPAPAR